MLVLFLVVTLLIMLFLGAMALDHNAQKPEPRGDHTQRYQYENLLEMDGVTYRPRRDLTTLLLMGIDTVSENAGANGYRNGGQADFLRLVVIDDTSGRVAQIQIDRDTMTPITVLGIMGNKAGVRTAQISLAQGFGDGKKQSCELTVDAVSNLLFGIPIDGYIAMNMDGISALNDIAGGITVTLEDDFSALDPMMTQGATLTLRGEQAEYFVRSRMQIGVGTNAARMARQELYISQMMSLLLEQVSKDKEFAGTLYDGLLPYLTTDMSRGRVINEAWNAKNYQYADVVKLSGKHTVGADGFMQFWVDDAALKQIVVSLFYQQVK